MQEIYITEKGVVFFHNMNEDTLEIPNQKEVKKWIGANKPEQYIKFLEKWRKAKMAVAKEIKETIAVTIDEVFKKMNSISWLERQKAMKDEAFKNTEKILYCFNILKEHVADEEGYLAMIQKSTSGSIVRYQKNKVDKPDEDQLLEDRIASYNRSKNDVERIEKALKKIEGKKGYEVIEMRYLQRKKTVENGKQVEEVYTFEEIADILGGQQGYNENLNEKTVRNYKNALVRDMAIFLFGSDAV